MATIRAGIKKDSQLLNLKEIDTAQIRSEVNQLLVDDETAVVAFKTIRDQVIFTTKRIIVVNVQGVIGKKVAYFSYPYSKVQYFGIETAGVLDVDSEMIVAFSNGTKLQFDFKYKVDIKKISSLVSSYVL